jgi:hypothetical protein
MVNNAATTTTITSSKGSPNVDSHGAYDHSYEYYIHSVGSSYNNATTAAATRKEGGRGGTLRWIGGC